MSSQNFAHTSLQMRCWFDWWLPAGEQGTYQTVPALMARARLLMVSMFLEKMPQARPYSELFALSMTWKEVYIVFMVFPLAFIPPYLHSLLCQNPLGHQLDGHDHDASPCAQETSACQQFKQRMQRFDLEDLGLWTISLGIDAVVEKIEPSSGPHERGRRGEGSKPPPGCPTSGWTGQVQISHPWQSACDLQRHK